MEIAKLRERCRELAAALHSQDWAVIRLVSQLRVDPGKLRSDLKDAWDAATRRVTTDA